MGVQQTSILAWLDVQPKLSNKQKEVMEALEEIQPADNRMLAKHLRWEINTITPRVNELRKKNRIERAYVGEGASGKLVNFWQVV